MTQYEAKRIRRQMQSFLSLMIVVASTVMLASCGGDGVTSTSTNVNEITKDTPNLSSIRQITAQDIQQSTTSSLKYVKGEIIVLLKEESDFDALSSYVKSKGWKIVSKGSSILNNYIIQTNLTAEDDLNVEIDKLGKQSFVNSASLNIVMKSNGLSSDPSWQDNDKSWNMKSINLQKAWSILPNAGNDVNVGVVDADFIFNHPDLKIYKDITPSYPVKGVGSSFFNWILGIEPRDPNDHSNDIVSAVRGSSTGSDPSHGMHVAGIIGATDNTDGMVGIAPHANIFSYNYMSNGEVATLDDAQTGIAELTKAKTQVINVSIGTDFCDSVKIVGVPTGETICKRPSDIETARYSHMVVKAFSRIIDQNPNVVFVQASGNNGKFNFDGTSTRVSTDYNGLLATALAFNDVSDQAIKSAVENVAHHTIIVGAYSQRSDGSNYITDYTMVPLPSSLSQTNTYLSSSFMLAPGGDKNKMVYSTVLTSGKYGYMWGTSMAAPHVTGVVALVMQANPSISATKARDIVLQSTDTVDSYPALDAEKAVRAALAYGKPTNITPTSATVGAAQEFTLTGDGLLEKPYSIAIEGCPNIQYTSATSTKHVFSCTPTDALSSLVVITNPDTGALVSKQLAIDFTSAPVALPTAVKITLDAQGINAVSGVVNGNVSFITGRNGGKAAKFNGVSDPASIRIPNTDNITFDTGATFDMWVRLDSMTGMNGNAQTVSNGQYVMTLLAKSHDRNGTAFTSTASGKSFWNTYNQTWAGSTSCTTNETFQAIPIGEWYRVTYAVSPATGIQTYINKQLYMNCPDIHPSFDAINSQDLYIGKYADEWYPLNGAIQDVSIYKAALTPSQIAVMP